jgi:hypothetical protein
MLSGTYRTFMTKTLLMRLTPEHVQGDAALKDLVLKVKRNMSAEHFNTIESLERAQSRIINGQQKLESAEKELDDCQREPFENAIIYGIGTEYARDSRTELLKKIKIS